MAEQNERLAKVLQLPEVAKVTAAADDGAQMMTPRVETAKKLREAEKNHEHGIPL